VRAHIALMPYISKISAARSAPDDESIELH